MQTFQELLSLQTIVRLLAYCHHYTIPYISGRGLPAQHLQRLSGWIGLPNNKIRSLRQHKLLAAHIVLLRAAGLIDHDGNKWWCSPIVEQWLYKPEPDMVQTLIEAASPSLWESMIQEEKLSDSFDNAYITFIQQSLKKQFFKQAEPCQPAVWKCIAESSWALTLPPNLPHKLTFYLLQIGEWNPQNPLCISPTSIAQARQKGYALDFIVHLLDKATQQPLSQLQEEQLLAWYLAAHNYKIQSLSLLSTAQPHQLTEILANQRLSRRVHQQISPRHAIVSPSLTKPLKKWLHKQNKYLQTAVTTDEAATSEAPNASYTWLSFKLVIELKGLLSLPISVPSDMLSAAASRLSAEEQSELAFTVEQIIGAVKQAIRGRDAFLPAMQPVPQSQLNKINQAIEADAPLKIAYQALGDAKATGRTIQPLRLEARGQLYYLYAYCYRTETNLTFRLDRIKELTEATITGSD